jgi:hypothetical protein
MTLTPPGAFSFDESPHATSAIANDELPHLSMRFGWLGGFSITT